MKTTLDNDDLLRYQASMKNILAFTTVFLAFLAFGCSDNSGPTQTVKSAYISLEKNQRQDFFSLLSNGAAETYGTQESIDALKQRLSGLKLQVGQATLKSTDQIFQNWSVPVVTEEDPNTPVLTATVLCESSHSNETQSENCSITAIDLN